MIGEIGRGLAVVVLAKDDPGDQELTRRVFEEGNLKSDLRLKTYWFQFVNLPPR